jgi:hypothetical protein
LGSKLLVTSQILIMIKKHAALLSSGLSKEYSTKKMFQSNSSKRNQRKVLSIVSLMATQLL